MKHSYRITFIVLSTLMAFTSCQKELSIEGADIPIKNLLIRSVATTGNDSLVTIYTYDKAGQLEVETTDGMDAGQPYHSYRRYIRDETGRLVTMHFMEAEGGIWYDTVRTTIHYPDATSLQFDYSVSVQDYFVDSMAFVYNGSNMTQVETYTDMGLGYTLSQRQEFEFNAGGNVSLTNFFSSVSSPDGSLMHTSVMEYSYGTEPDYLWATANAAQNFWYIGLPNAQNLNVEQLSVSDQTGTGVDIEVLTELELGINEKPATGVRVVAPYNWTTTYAFYYQ